MTTCTACCRSISTIGTISSRAGYATICLTVTVVLAVTAVATVAAITTLTTFGSCSGDINRTCDHIAATGNLTCRYYSCAAIATCCTNSTCAASNAIACSIIKTFSIPVILSVSYSSILSLTTFSFNRASIRNICIMKIFRINTDHINAAARYCRTLNNVLIYQTSNTALASKAVYRHRSNRYCFATHISRSSIFIVKIAVIRRYKNIRYSSNRRIGVQSSTCSCLVGICRILQRCSSIATIRPRLIRHHCPGSSHYRQRYCCHQLFIFACFQIHPNQLLKIC